MASEQQQRQLAVILHADIEGSTALVRHDETLAHERITDAFNRFSETIERYGGRVHEVRGDALVAEFARASDAVCAALAFQRSQATHRAALSDEIATTIRIGISLGEVVFADGTVTGAGVVLAQRVEQLAEPDGVCITGAIHEAVPERMPFDQESLGEQAVKGFDEPVRVYAVRMRDGAELPEPTAIPVRRKIQTARWITAIAAVILVAGGGLLAWWQLWQPREEPASVERMAFPLPDRPSIAVLPFDNLSGDPQRHRLVDGITEDIITSLSRFREFFVIARNSTFVYKDKPTDVRQIARELGVQYVLEGSLQIEGDRVRITAQLIDAINGNHVWAERYDRQLEDVFAIQDEVTDAIVGSLGGQHGAVARSRRETARREPADRLQAYETYALGVELKHHRTEADNRKARELFEKAIELDPNFTRAYIGLAQIHGDTIDFGWAQSRQVALQHMVTAARKALSLDPYESQAHYRIGLYYLYQNDFQQALVQHEQAIELNPNDADVLAAVAWDLTKLGQPERSVEVIKRAIRLNPHGPDWYGGPMREAYFHNRQFEETIAVTKKRIHPDPLWDPLYRAMSYAQLGREKDVAPEVKQLFVADPDYSAEKWLNDMGSYARDTELNLFLESNRKAGLPLCATEEQLNKYPKLSRLEECEKQRATN
jgi:TolB-like protein/class 3 adenylate cyclase